MGVIVITTMDTLPDYCYDCPCHDGEHSTCEADKEKRTTIEYRPYWCPLKKRTLMDREEQQKQILEWLQNAYAGARALDDLGTMTRIARAVEAFELPVSKDVIIACKEKSN